LVVSGVRGGTTKVPEPMVFSRPFFFTSRGRERTLCPCGTGFRAANRRRTSNSKSTALERDLIKSAFSNLPFTIFFSPSLISVGPRRTGPAWARARAGRGTSSQWQAFRLAAIRPKACRKPGGSPNSTPIRFPQPSSELTVIERSFFFVPPRWPPCLRGSRSPL